MTGRRLAVDADLQIRVDGVEARLIGRDGDLVLQTDDPARLLGAVRRGGTDALGRIVVASDATGVTVTVEGRRGAVLRLGRRPQHRSRWTLPVRPAGIEVLRPQDLVPPAVRWAAGGAVVVAAALLIGRLRR